MENCAVTVSRLIIYKYIIYNILISVQTNNSVERYFELKDNKICQVQV